MSNTTLTPASLSLFRAFAEDAGNWNGTPLVGGNFEITHARRAITAWYTSIALQRRTR